MLHSSSACFSILLTINDELTFFYINIRFALVKQKYRDGMAYPAPLLFSNEETLSIFSHVKEGSFLPKWPYAAVFL